MPEIKNKLGGPAGYGTLLAIDCDILTTDCFAIKEGWLEAEIIFAGTKVRDNGIQWIRPDVPGDPTLEKAAAASLEANQVREST